MRRLILLAALSLVLVACGSSAGTKTPPTPMAHGTRIEFGVKGGNITPFTITIRAAGKISEVGTLQISKRSLTGAAVSRLSGSVESGLSSLSSRQCKGTLPDVGSRFIRADGKSVTVHGSCEAGFEQLWSKLTAAAGLD